MIGKEEGKWRAVGGLRVFFQRLLFGGYSCSFPKKGSLEVERIFDYGYWASEEGDCDGVSEV